MAWFQAAKNGWTLAGLDEEAREFVQAYCQANPRSFIPDKDIQQDAIAEAIEVSCKAA